VSRRFVAATETALAELLAADLSALDLVALFSMGALGEHCCVVALGIDGDCADASPPRQLREVFHLDPGRS
jgi:hypothetical protein